MKRAVFIILFILPFLSCDNDKEGDRYTISNIIVASFHVIKDKGIDSLSSEEIGKEIDKMYRSPDEILQKPSTLRQQSDGTNDYGIIFEDRIKEDRYQESRTKKDFFKERREK